LFRILQSTFYFEIVLLISTEKNFWSAAGNLVNVKHVIGWIHLSAKPVNIRAQENKKMLMVCLDSYVEQKKRAAY